MKIVKKLITKNEKTKLVSDIFEECVEFLNYRFFDSLELVLKQEDQIKLDFPKAYIYLNYNDPFIQSKDKKAIKIILLKKLVSLAIIYRYQEIKLPSFINNIIANREIIRKGLGKDLFYYQYILLTQYEPKKVQELDTFMEINIPWLSYFGIDNYDSKFMKKMLKSFTYKKEFESITRPLFNNVKKDLLKGKSIYDAVAVYNSIKKNRR